MNFLVDNALSPVIAGELTHAGYNAVHVRDFGMQAATDHEVFEFAEREDRIVVSADTDFGTILAQLQSNKPSVILIRTKIFRRPDEQAKLLLVNLPACEADLNSGAIVVIEDGRIRIRSLPIPP